MQLVAVTEMRAVPALRKPKTKTATLQVADVNRRSYTHLQVWLQAKIRKSVFQGIRIRNRTPLQAHYPPQPQSSKKTILQHPRSPKVTNTVTKKPIFISKTSRKTSSWHPQKMGVSATCGTLNSVLRRKVFKDFCERRWQIKAVYQFIIQKSEQENTL